MCVALVRFFGLMTKSFQICLKLRLKLNRKSSQKADFSHQKTLCLLRLKKISIGVDLFYISCWTAVFRKSLGSTAFLAIFSISNYCKSSEHRPPRSSRFSLSRAPPTSSARYVRHRPETTLLYQVVREYWPEFQAKLASQGKHLPTFVCREFDEYLKCGRLEHGFLRVRCEACHHEKLVSFSCKRRGFCPSCGARRMADSAALLMDEVLPHQPMRQWVLSVPFPLRFLFASQPDVMGRVLGIVYRTIATHLTHKAGYTNSRAHTGAVTLIQRFGGAVNLNIHFHMLFLDGVYIDCADKSLVRFRWVKAPTSDELTQLTHTIARRIARYLERQGLLERDVEGAWLTSCAGGGENEATLDHVLGSSVTYRIAIGPQQGRKVFTLQTLPDCRPDFTRPQTGNTAGFSLHAGVATKDNERAKLERLCRYIARPAVSNQRLSLTHNGRIRYQLKTPYSDGTTHVIFEPLDFIARLVALVPKPRVNPCLPVRAFIRKR